MTEFRQAGVQCPVALRLVVPEESSVPIRASLVYRPVDPYAVQIVFHAGLDDESADVSWSFSRELLAEGMYRQSGMGDVKVWPWAGKTRHAVGMALSSPDGYALFEMPRPAIEQFLVRTYAVVPAGHEDQQVDMDAELAALLSAPDADAR